MIEIKTLDFLSDDERMLRNKVFVEEQNFKDEFDITDSASHHLVLYVDRKPAACVRFFTENNPTEYHLGRLCVLKEYRGQSLGSLLVSEVEKHVKELGGTAIVLSAQMRASGFYEKLGYAKKGNIYYDEYCEHICMYKLISDYNSRN